MDLVTLGDVQLRYTSLESLDYEAGGQLFGTMEERLEGERVRGDFHLTNLAPRRADSVNLPTLRGLLRTDDEAVVYVEMDGIATLREADQARVFVTTVRLRTGDTRYRWMNTIFGVLEGVLDTVSSQGIARGRAYYCVPTISTQA